jgi:hypothetical protein
MLSARAAQTTPEFVASAAQAATARTAPTGQTLAGSSNPRLNTAFALLCHLQVQSY